MRLVLFYCVSDRVYPEFSNFFGCCGVVQQNALAGVALELCVSIIFEFRTSW